MSLNKNNPRFRPLRMTRQRRVILEQFRTPGRHFTADDVFLMVRKELPNISLGTVYRNLDILCQAGRIRRINLGGGQRQYDGGLHRHYHVRCVRCGKVVDVPPDRIGDLNAAAAQTTDFEVLDHELGFIGVCPECGGPAERLEPSDDSNADNDNT